MILSGVKSNQSGTASLTESLSWEDDFGRGKRLDSGSFSITPYYVNLFKSSAF